MTATAFLPAKSSSACCDCKKSEDPCTCCDFSDTQSYSEVHGYGECPDVGQPCGSAESGSCADRRIGPKELISKEFPTKCLKSKKPKAAVSISADNFGYIMGESGKVGCPNSNDCQTCSQSGTLKPFVVTTGEKSRMKVKAWSQNAPHGGPYSLYATANFYLE